MTAIADLLRVAADRLRSAGVEAPRLDARLLLGHVLGREVWPHERDAVADSAREAFEALLTRRMAREPASRILGRRAFWTLDLALGPETLDPRPDSETLIEAAVEAFHDRAPPARLLDLGTGTGCLLLAALAEFPRASGLGIDRAAGAVAVARQNATANGSAGRARFEVADWTQAVIGPVDLILCNPPYVEIGAVRYLAPEVTRHDPPAALFAGADGLDAYRELAPLLGGMLAPGGVVVLELGQGQRDRVAALMTEAGLVVVASRDDLSGMTRALVLQWNDSRDD
ncbi:MAG: peptide chain release factor N(5)-glutamine methyltransferase [Alphaproteobacteria bacterium]|nr:peptide chain release factor N(5)-glutamine methyltransferase [Alphaproteobacteria bacterium]